MLLAPPAIWTVKMIAMVVLTFNIFGCAIYYRDADSGAEHIWGFGHLAMKATPPQDGKQALIRRMTLTGVNLGIDEGSFGMSVGWDQRERLIIYDENTALTIQRPPSNDLFQFTIGSYPLEFNPANNKNEQSSEVKEDHR